MAESIRASILAVCRELVVQGLVSGTAGNVSARDGDRLWITPSGMAYAVLTADDLVAAGPDGGIVAGRRRPSVELPMHLACYAADEGVQAVVHTHPVHVMALSMLGWPLPPVLDSIAGRFGGEVPVLDYAPSGSAELAAIVGRSAPEHPAMILRQHGLVVTGKTLAEALDTTLLVERSAAAYLLARSAGEVAPLPPEVVAERRAFALTRYGQTIGEGTGRADHSGP